jgi:uncharacterized protein (TIRG00374 family)
LRKGVIQALKFTAFLVVGLILLWLAFRKTDYNMLIGELKKANYSWLLLSVLFGFLAFLSRARRWELLINPLGYKPSFINSFYALMTGYLANLALPRIGEVTRCVALGRKEKIPVDQLIGTVVVERTIDFISLLTISIILFLTSSDKIELFLKESIFLPAREKALVLFGATWILWVIVFAFLIIAFILIIRHRKKLRKIRFFSKMFDLARGIINGLKTITNLESKWEFIFHTFFIWINYSLMTWVVVFALESTAGITYRESIFLLVIGGLAMSAPVQSGFGVFHYTISRGMVVLKGIPIEDGLVYALLTHESQLIFVAIAGTISFFMMFRKNKDEAVNPVEPLDDLP